ncbi:hypothetical protein JHW43_001298 [Diplocarpon mali]|nr:hypothetical protein JHW43_001298 [Diplocarpon mali]
MESAEEDIGSKENRSISTPALGLMIGSATSQEASALALTPRTANSNGLWTSNQSSLLGTRLSVDPALISAPPGPPLMVPAASTSNLTTLPESLIGNPLTSKIWVPLETFALFQEFPLELRRMVYNEALPAPSVLQLGYTIRKKKSKEVTVSNALFYPQLDNDFSKAHLYAQREIGLLSAHRESREVYIRAMPINMPMTIKGRRSLKGALHLSHEDLIYLDTFWRFATDSRVFPLNRTIQALVGQKWTGQITRIAFSKMDFREAFGTDTYDSYIALLPGTLPRLQEIKIAEHEFREYVPSGPGSVPDSSQNHILLGYQKVDPNEPHDPSWSSHWRWRTYCNYDQILQDKICKNATAISANWMPVISPL